MNVRYGYVKKDWKLMGVSSETDKHAGRMAFDADARTYWKSADGKDQSITIDMGAPKKINGFIYTPQTRNQEGMIAKWRVEVSRDGKKWRDAGIYEFGNLINDPTPREQKLSKTAGGRYVKFTALETAADSPCATIAEIDVF